MFGDSSYIVGKYKKGGKAAKMWTEGVIFFTYNGDI